MGPPGFPAPKLGEVGPKATGMEPAEKEDGRPGERKQATPLKKTARNQPTQKGVEGGNPSNKKVWLPPPVKKLTFPSRLFTLPGPAGDAGEASRLCC